jgi:hypothetical protein
MATLVNKKHVPKGVRLGWTPLKEVKSVELTSDLVKGEKITDAHPDNKNSSNPAISYLIP